MFTMPSLEGQILHRFVDRPERANVFLKNVMTLYTSTGQISQRNLYFIIGDEFFF